MIIEDIIYLKIEFKNDYDGLLTCILDKEKVFDIKNISLILSDDNFIKIEVKLIIDGITYWNNKFYSWSEVRSISYITSKKEI